MKNLNWNIYQDWGVAISGIANQYIALLIYTSILINMIFQFNQVKLSFTLESIDFVVGEWVRVRK